VFLSKDDIKKRCPRLLGEKGFDEKGFEHSKASYDLQLGEEVLVTPDREPKRLQENQALNIDSGQFAILTTEEVLEIPGDMLGLITIRFRYKSKGLVNISGFHVDPGFQGRLVFSVYNVGPTTVTLRRGERVFSIFLAEITSPVDYPGDYKGQQNIPMDIIETFAGARVPSLQTLENRVNRTSTALKIYGTILTGLVVTLLAALIQQILKVGA
jgi:dCTP deaminase